ncbi:unnamed protein product [Peronospora farinosa]|uniref:Uncharacterized protein n=1 Tax=Peronospora farinosa TaxID=134698 RepID=A0AAV0U5P2_9STRA|nr:unnamed protein product [Peronospora farinosa]
MTSPGNESQTLRDLIEGDLDEAVDYESDTVFVGPDGSPLTTLTGEDDSSHAPNPFPEHGAADALTALLDPPDVSSTATVTDPLDKKQQQTIDKEEGAKRRTKNMARLQGQVQATYSGRTPLRKHLEIPFLAGPLGLRPFHPRISLRDRLFDNAIWNPISLRKANTWHASLGKCAVHQFLS